MNSGLIRFKNTTKSMPALQSRVQQCSSPTSSLPDTSPVHKSHDLHFPYQTIATMAHDQTRGSLVSDLDDDAMDYSQYESKQWSDREAALQYLVGSTPHSTLSRKSKAPHLVACFEQALEHKAQYAHGTSSPRHVAEPTDNGDAAEKSSSQYGLKFFTSSQSSGAITPTRQRARTAQELPIVGQRYTVVQPWITLRAFPKVETHNAVVCTVKKGRSVRILRFVEQANDKLRVQVLTNDEEVGWCTMISGSGEMLLKLAPEEV
eukprot:GEMP01023656.1.p1 GENE.GEMP01023656.1~~GEMP01023656.1.p1  ORF type:complete len:262 (+),score=66.27 GEMP01023656.1:409-1194(+)